MKHLKFKNLLLFVAITTGLASCGGNNSNTSSSTSNSGGGETPISSSSTSSSGSTLDSSTSSTNTGDTEQMIKEGVYYRSPKIASKVYVVDARKLTKAERIMLVSLQGILAQEESTIYFKNVGEDKEFFEQIQNSSTFEVVYEDDAWKLVDLFKNKINSKRFVSFTSIDTSGFAYDLSINHAATISGVEKWLMVESTIVPKALEHGLIFGKDATSYTTRSVFEEYKDYLNPQFIIHQNPSKVELRDYGIAGAALCVYTDYEKNDTSIFSDIADWANENAPIIGWTENEINFVSMNSLKSLVTLAADWSSNLSFESAYRPADKITKKNYENTEVKAEKGKHYVAIVMSDGDNVQWMQRGFASDSRWYGSSKRGQFPMTWTVSPGLVDLSPALLESVYERGTAKDDFIAGPSGLGYVNIAEYNESSLEDYAAKTAGYLERSDITSINFLDNFIDSDRLSYFSQYSQVHGGIWSVGNMYLEGEGGVYWSNDKPFISVRDTLWRIPGSLSNDYYGYTERVAQRINEYSTDPTKIEGYSVVLCHAWSIGTMEYISRFVQQLDDHVELVTVDQMVDMVAKNVAHEDVDTLDDIKPSDIKELCTIDSTPIYYKQIKDYPTTDLREFHFKNKDDLGGWSLNCGGLEYDKCAWNNWSSEGTGSILLDGSDLDDREDAIPNSYIYNKFDLTSADKYFKIKVKGGSNADTNFRVTVLVEDESEKSGAKTYHLTDGYPEGAQINEHGYYLRKDGSNVTEYTFSLEAFSGKHVAILVEQDDNGDGSGEQIYIDSIIIGNN